MLSFKTQNGPSYTLLHPKIPIPIHQPRSHPIPILIRHHLSLFRASAALDAARAALRLFFDSIDGITALLRGSVVGGFADAARDGFVFLGSGGGGGGFCFLGGAGGGVGVFAAERGLGTSTGIDFSFEDCGFFFDDAEAAFDAVVGGACGGVRLYNEVEEEHSRLSLTAHGGTGKTYRCRTWWRSCGNQAREEVLSGTYLEEVHRVER